MTNTLSGAMPITFVPSPALYPFASHWFPTPAGRIHYIDEGAGEPILFVHGNPTWSFLYRHIVAALRDRYRCIAVDLLGFGLSDRPDAAQFGYTAAEHAALVRDFIAGLDLHDLTIMGQDWGGPIGLWAAAAERDRVRRLVMGNTWYWPIRDSAGQAFSHVLSSPPLRWLITERNFFVEQLIPAGLARPLDPDEMQHYRAVFPTPATRLGPAIFPREIRTAEPFLAELEARVTTALRDVPLLMVWGMRDPLFPPEAAARFRSPFTDATFVALPTARHFIQEDAPGEIVAAMTAWLPQH
jgi:haloalkane dehalogenase